VLFLLIYGIPLVTLFVTSLFDYKIYPNKFNFIGLMNYVNMFKSDPTFLTAFFNTIAWVVIHCVINISLGVIIALLLLKKPFGWKFVRTVYMIPNIISSAAMGIIFLNIYNAQYGVVNTFIRLFGNKDFSKNWLFDSNTAFGSVTLTWILFGAYTMILVLSEALAIPDEIFEAARVDGANNFQIDIHITLPMLRNVIGTTVIMGATYMLQMFDLIYLTTQGGPGTATTNLPLYLYKTAMISNNYGYANAIGSFIIVLGVGFLFIINRTFRIGKTDY
jgi:raffinose/stachyose/melibiose transport system permease protein